jgi:hypothetical protein
VDTINQTSEDSVALSVADSPERMYVLKKRSPFHCPSARVNIVTLQNSLIRRHYPHVCIEQARTVSDIE